jgi:hypothetical protein
LPARLPEDWFLPFAREIRRALKPQGSFVLNIGGSFNPGLPTRSLYPFKLLIALVEEVRFHLSRRFRGAELDMHFSLSADLTPLNTYLETLRVSGYPRATTLLERGDY